MKTISDETKICLVYIDSGNPVSFETSLTNSTNCCGEFQTELCSDTWPSDNIWYAKSIEHALRVIENSTPWYNSDEENPTHDLEPDNIKLVKRFISIKESDVIY